MATAKVFMSGRSQAVRIPKAFRFDTDEVDISREGDAVVLRPKRLTNDEKWDRVFAALDALGDDFMPNGREQPEWPPIDPDEMFD